MTTIPIKVQLFDLNSKVSKLLVKFHLFMLNFYIYKPF